jgi:hypothetical protein
VRVRKGLLGLPVPLDPKVPLGLLDLLGPMDVPGLPGLTDLLDLLGRWQN